MSNPGKLVFSAILSLACAGVVSGAGYDDCQKAIREQVTQNNPNADKIVFRSAGESHKEVSRTETLYEGNGGFTRHTGKQETFAWRCTYDSQKRTISNVHYRVNTDASSGSSGQTNTCQDAIRDRIQKENRGSGAVTFVTSRSSKLHGSGDLIEGTGHAALKGKDTNFNYHCIFNEQGTLTDKRYELK
jgi:hypothetical protein